MHRALPRRRIDVNKLADRAGRWAGSLAKSLPGLAGATFFCIGLAMIYHPAGLIGAGVFLLIVDRRS
jgi:hypothetical protein